MHRSAQAFNVYLSKQQERLGQVSNLRATDAAGLIKFGAGVDPTDRSTSPTASNFQRARAQPDLAFAPPILARTTGRWEFRWRATVEWPTDRSRAWCAP